MSTWGHTLAGKQLRLSGTINPLRTRYHHIPPRSEHAWHYHPDLCYQIFPKSFPLSLLPATTDQDSLRMKRLRCPSKDTGWFVHILQNQVFEGKKDPSLHFHMRTPLELITKRHQLLTFPQLGKVLVQQFFSCEFGEIVVVKGIPCRTFWRIINVLLGGPRGAWRSGGCRPR